MSIARNSLERVDSISKIKFALINLDNKNLLSKCVNMLDARDREKNKIYNRA